jgi:hypothetical protein
MEPHYWEYFLTIEGDLLTAARWVEFDERNYDVFSVAFSRMLQATGGECDVLSKKVCEAAGLTLKSKNMNMEGYRKAITGHFHNFPRQVVHLPRYKLEFSPWSQWGQTEEPKNPKWWRAYTNVKHARHTHFHEATLGHTLDAVSGLLCLLLYYYKLTEGPDVRLAPLPQLLVPKKYEMTYVGKIGMTYDLDEEGVAMRPGARRLPAIGKKESP